MSAMCIYQFVCILCGVCLDQKHRLVLFVNIYLVDINCLPIPPHPARLLPNSFLVDLLKNMFFLQNSLNLNL